MVKTRSGFGRQCLPRMAGEGSGVSIRLTIQLFGNQWHVVEMPIPLKSNSADGTTEDGRIGWRDAVSDSCRQDFVQECQNQPLSSLTLTQLKVGSIIAIGFRLWVASSPNSVTQGIIWVNHGLLPTDLNKDSRSRYWDTHSNLGSYQPWLLWWCLTQQDGDLSGSNSSKFSNIDVRKNELRYSSKKFNVSLPSLNGKSHVVHRD